MAQVRINVKVEDRSGAEGFLIERLVPADLSAKACTVALQSRIEAALEEFLADAKGTSTRR